MSDSQNNPNAETLDEDLVAYLDGELDTAEAQKVETLLASDPHARTRLNHLAASWDLLEQLPRAVVDDLFTRTTVEMVAVAVEEEISHADTAAPKKRRLQWMTAAAATLIAGAVGFVAAALALPDRNDSLLHDLPVVRNLELYRALGNIGLLGQFEASNLFAEDVKDTSPGAASGSAQPPTIPPPIPKSMADRREWIETLSPVEKTELRRSFEKFTALPVREQQTLRQLDQELRSQPNADELRRMTQRFYEWLKTISPAERAELAELPLEQQAGEVKRLKHLQDSRTFDRLSRGPGSDNDLQEIVRWMREFAVEHRAELIPQLPPQRQREAERLKPDDQGDRRQLATMLATVMWRPSDPQKLPKIAESDLKPLLDDLSPDRKDALRAAPDSAARLALLRSWLQAALQARAIGPGGWRGGSGWPGGERFRDLSPEERQRIMNLDPTERAQELRKIFEKRGQSERRPGFKGPPDGPGLDGPRGRPDSRPGGNAPPNSPNSSDAPQG